MKKKILFLLAILCVVACVSCQYNVELDTTTGDSESLDTEGITTEDSTFEESASEESTSEETTSEETTSEENTSEENTSEENTSEENTSEENTSEEITSEENTSEENTSEEITSEEITSEENTSEENTSEEITSEEITTENFETVEIELGVYGEPVTDEMDVELGELCVVPPVTATIDDETVPVNVKVLDSSSREIEIINNKFRVSDMNGYTIVFKVTYGRTEKTHVIDVAVFDTMSPEFIISEKKGTAYSLGCEVEIPACKVIDASLPANTLAEVSVIGPNGNEVVTENGKFVLNTRGEYIVKYTAEDANGNVGEREFIISCRSNLVLNDFEQTDDVSPDVSVNVTVDSEHSFKGNSQKVTFTQNNMWKILKVPFKKANGTPYTVDELKLFDALQMYVYSSSANTIEFSGVMKNISVGKNIVNINMIDLLRGVSYNQESGMLSVNIQTLAQGEYIVFDEFMAICDLPEITMYMQGYDVFPGAFYGGSRQYFTIPELSARNNGNKLDVEVFVYNSNGDEINVTGGRFRVLDSNGYKIVYRISNGDKIRDIEIPLKSVTDVNAAPDSQMFNSFVCESDVDWMPATIKQEFVADGLKLEATEAISWARICVPFRNNDGSFVTWDELKTFEYIEISFTASYSSEIGMATMTKPFVAGDNVITFTMEEIISAYSTTEGTSNQQYQANGQGFYLNLKAAGVGDSIVISSIVGFNID